jgi:hypothetical protein
MPVAESHLLSQDEPDELVALPASPAASVPTARASHRPVEAKKSFIYSKIHFYCEPNEPVDPGWRGHQSNRQGRPLDKNCGTKPFFPQTQTK